MRVADIFLGIRTEDFLNMIQDTECYLHANLLMRHGEKRRCK
jgi:hypothetical protein